MASNVPCLLVVMARFNPFSSSVCNHLPGGSDGKASAYNVGRPRFDPWVGKILWRRKWQPTPVLLPGKSHAQRIVVGYRPLGRKESDTTEWLHFHFLWVRVESSDLLLINCCCFSVTQSCPSDFLRPCGLKHSRLPYPSLSPGGCSNLCPLSRWCYPTISSSVIPFFSYQN